MSRHQWVIVTLAKAGVQGDRSVESTVCCQSVASGLALALDSRLRGNDDRKQHIGKSGFISGQPMETMTKTDPSKPAPRRAAARCPICGKPASARNRPFCSSRCANIDLGRWLGGTYRVATDETPESAADTPDDAER